jgi:hypothetical protein
MLHQDHSGSSSSLVPTLSSPEDSRRSSDITDATTPSSPPPSGPSPPRHINENKPTNPFSNDYAYVEDYGPEYANGYVDVDDGLYGGHRSLDAYPVPDKSERRGSKSGKSEWPLKNVEWPLKSLGSRGRRERSPQWDRVYER